MDLFTTLIFQEKEIDISSTQAVPRIHGAVWGKHKNSVSYGRREINGTKGYWNFTKGSSFH